MSPMTSDDDMTLDYALVLKNLQQELDGMESRRKALVTAIAGMRGLVEQSAQHRLDLGDEPAVVELNGNGSGAKHAIPPGFFTGKTLTQAFRDLQALRPGDYTAPQLADIFEEGGVTAKSRTELLQGIHSVLKRHRDRLRKAAAATP